jgi:hypothetical protein
MHRAPLLSLVWGGGRRRRSFKAHRHNAPLAWFYGEILIDTLKAKEKTLHLSELPTSLELKELKAE